MTNKLKELGRVAPEERRARGAALNVVKDTVSAAIEQRRGALEKAALDARLAAERMPAEALQELLRELELDRQKTLSGTAHDAEPARAFDFHERIVRGCGNTRIIDALCGDLYHLLRIYRRRSGAVPVRKSRAYSEHWQIVRALRARDGDLAESLMRSHIARAEEHLFTNLPQFPGDPAASQPAPSARLSQSA